MASMENFKISHVHNLDSFYLCINAFYIYYRTWESRTPTIILDSLSTELLFDKKSVQLFKCT